MLKIQVSAGYCEVLKAVLWGRSCPGIPPPRLALSCLLAASREKEGKKMNPFDYKIVPEPFLQIR